MNKAKKIAVLIGVILVIAFLIAERNMHLRTILTALAGSGKVAKLVAEEISASAASAVVKQSKGEDKSQEGRKEEEEQIETQEKEEPKKEETEEQLLTLKRDPFSFWAEKGDGGDLQTIMVTPEEISLQGIIYDPPDSRVIIHDQIVGVGDEVDGKRIEKIEPNRIILIDIDGRRKLICPLGGVEGKR